MMTKSEHSFWWMFVVIVLVSMALVLWTLPAKAQWYSLGWSQNNSIQYRQAPPPVVGPLQVVNGPLPRTGLVPVSAQVNTFTNYSESGNLWGVSPLSQVFGSNGGRAGRGDAQKIFRDAEIGKTVRTVLRGVRDVAIAQSQRPQVVVIQQVSAPAGNWQPPPPAYSPPPCREVRQSAEISQLFCS